MAEAFDPYYKWLGIPPAEQPPNHYRLLGLTLFEPDPDVIGNAADQRMAHVRTFQAGRHSDLSQRVLNEIATARVCLLNAEKKAEYDRALQQASAWAPRLEPPTNGTPAFPPVPPALPVGSFSLPPPVPLAPTPVPPSVESMMEGSAPSVTAPPPVAWVDDTASRYPSRSTKAAWHGVAVFLGVLAVASLGLWTAWQKSAPEDRSRPGTNKVAVVPVSPGPVTPPDKTDGKAGTRLTPPRTSPKKHRDPSIRPPKSGKPAVAVSPPAPATQPNPSDAKPVPPKQASPTPATSPTPAATATAKPQKGAAPDAAAQKAAEEKLASTLAGGSASTLRTAAQDAQRDPAERFVLLTKAVDSAAAAGDVAAAMALIEEKASQFEIDALAEKARTLTAMRAAAAAPEAFRVLTEQMLVIVEQPASPLPRDQLGRLAETTIGAARKSGDVELIKRATLRFLKLREADNEGTAKEKPSSPQP